MLIRGGPTLTNIENAAGYGSSRALFRKDEQGDLVARVRIHFTGIVLLVPASFTGASELHWHGLVSIRGSLEQGCRSEWKRAARFRVRNTGTLVGTPCIAHRRGSDQEYSQHFQNLVQLDAAKIGPKVYDIEGDRPDQEKSCQGRHAEKGTRE